MELQSITQIFQKLHQILAGLPVSLISVKIPFAEDHKAIVSVKIEQRVFVLAFQIHKLAAQHRLDPLNRKKNPKKPKPFTYLLMVNAIIATLIVAV